MKTITTSTRTATAMIGNGRSGSLCLAKYIKNIQQANKKTATEYQYRLSRFERFIAVIESKQLQQQLQNKEPIITTASLDRLIDQLKMGSNKIDPYDLLSGFVAYQKEHEGIENPNTIRHFVITARNFLNITI